MQILVLSDIHANVSALQAVLNGARTYNIGLAVLLGDHVDYGMRPNEIITILKDFPYPIDVNICGNHERLIVDGNLQKFKMFFSPYTGSILSAESTRYICEEMNTEGFTYRTYDGKRCLMIHGSIEDTFWSAISTKSNFEKYREYDYVFSGHSHLPLCFEQYFNQGMNNEKKTVFVNPGSVGQPRNHNPRACYCVFDTISGWVHLNNAEYDVTAEQSLYGTEVDSFHSRRLSKGI
jgi:predicted phosphodiesterase